MTCGFADGLRFGRRPAGQGVSAKLNTLTLILTTMSVTKCMFTYSHIFLTFYQCMSFTFNFESDYFMKIKINKLQDMRFISMFLA